MNDTESSDGEDTEPEDTDPEEPGACPATIDVWDNPRNPVPEPVPFLACELDSPCADLLYEGVGAVPDQEAIVCVMDQLSAGTPGAYRMSMLDTEGSIFYEFRLYEDGIAEYWNYRDGEYNSLFHAALSRIPGHDFSSCVEMGADWPPGDCVRAGFSACSAWGTEQELCP